MIYGIVVSIPSGSINSVGNDYAVFKTEVSIPSGSINRIKKRTQIYAVFLFQFLLVQLIGAGKLYPAKLIKFQFLLVQLIVGSVAGAMSDLLFQFLLVQLIAFLVGRSSRAFLVSIPSGSINRTTEQAPAFEYDCFNSFWFN